MTVLVLNLKPSGAKLQLTSGSGTWKETTGSDCFPVLNGQVQDDGTNLISKTGADLLAKLIGSGWSNGPRHGNAKLDLVVDTPDDQTWGLAP